MPEETNVEGKGVNAAKKAAKKEAKAVKRAEHKGTSPQNNAIITNEGMI